MSYLVPVARLRTEFIELGIQVGLLAPQGFDLTKAGHHERNID